MWIVVTSDGRRISDVGAEVDARRAVHALGVTQLRGPYCWDVVDNLGRRFAAEIKHRWSEADHRAPPADTGTR